MIHCPTTPRRVKASGRAVYKQSYPGEARDIRAMDVIFVVLYQPCDSAFIVASRRQRQLCNAAASWSHLLTHCESRRRLSRWAACSCSAPRTFFVYSVWSLILIVSCSNYFSIGLPHTHTIGDPTFTLAVFSHSQSSLPPSLISDDLTGSIACEALRQYTSSQ